MLIKSPWNVELMSDHFIMFVRFTKYSSFIIYLKKMSSFEMAITNSVKKDP